MSRQQCSRCATPVSDGYLCSACIRALERGLSAIAVLLPLLDDTVTRVDVVHRSNVHRASHTEPEPEQPTAGRLIAAMLRSPHDAIALPATAIPVDLDAAQLRRDVRASLAAWTSWIPGRGHPALLEAAHRACGDLDCGHRWCEQARAARNPHAARLYANAGELRHVADAHQLVSHILRARRAVQSAVDRRDPDVFAGPCDAPSVILDDHAPDGRCLTELWAHPDDRTVTCPACGTSYDIRERKQRLLDLVRDVWARPAVIAQALTSMGMPLTQSRLDNWISRDRAQHTAGRPRRQPYPPILQVATDYQDEHGHDVMEPLVRDGQPILDEGGRQVLVPAGRPLFRVGDVMERLEWFAADQARAMAETA